MSNLLERLNSFPVEDQYTDSHHIVEYLQELNTISPIRIHHREIAFVSQYDKDQFCNQFANVNPNGLGLVNEMFTGRTQINGLFLLKNRQPSGNSYAYDVINAAPHERQYYETLNGLNLLPWHTTSLFVFNSNLLYFDACVNPFEISSNNSLQTLRSLNFRSKITEYIRMAESRGITIGRIFVTGVAHITAGNPRALALNFMKDVIRSRILGQQCTNYFCVEVVKGPSPPSVSRELQSFNQF